MTDRIILYGLIAFIASIVLGLLKKSTGKNIEKQLDGNYYLRMNIFYGIIGIIASIFCLGFLLFFLFANQIDGAAIFGILLMFVIFGFPGIVCSLYYFNHKVKFDSSSITVTNIYTNTETVEWSKIIDAKFNAITGLVTFYTVDKKIKVHQHLVGLTNLIATVEDKTELTEKLRKVPINREKK